MSLFDESSCDSKQGCGSVTYTSSLHPCIIFILGMIVGVVLGIAIAI
jgi:hypothetical protein